MILYFDGDSFIAGTELADDLISGHPGYLPFDASPELREKNQNWISRTYSGDLVSERDFYKDIIAVKEKERCFANKVSVKLDVPIVNESLGGSSMEAISRRTITNLLKLKRHHTDIVAFIGTTDIWRSEIAYPNNEWVSIQPSTTWYEKANPVIEYKVMYEKNYHGLVRFYKNLILIKDFCRVNNIRVHFIQTVTNIEDWVVEKEFANRDDYNELKKYADLKYSLSMSDIAKNCNLPDVLCPSYHFSETVHQLVADKILEIL